MTKPGASPGQDTSGNLDGPSPASSGRLTSQLWLKHWGRGECGSEKRRKLGKRYARALPLTGSLSFTFRSGVETISPSFNRPSSGSEKPPRKCTLCQATSHRAWQFVFSFSYVSVLEPKIPLQAKASCATLGAYLWTIYEFFCSSGREQGRQDANAVAAVLLFSGCLHDNRRAQRRLPRVESRGLISAALDGIARAGVDETDGAFARRLFSLQRALAVAAESHRGDGPGSWLESFLAGRKVASPLLRRKRNAADAPLSNSVDNRSVSSIAQRRRGARLQAGAAHTGDFSRSAFTTFSGQPLNSGSAVLPT